MTSPNTIEAVARGIYEGEGWHKTDGTPIPWESVPEEHGHYFNGAMGALQAVQDNETDEEIEAMARAICRAHRTGSGHQSERAMQETEDNAWEQHIPDAKAARQAMLTVMKEA